MVRDKFDEFANKVKVLANQYDVCAEWETDEFDGRIIFYTQLHDDGYKESNEQMGWEDLEYLMDEEDN